MVNLQKRKEEVIKNIEQQGLLTGGIKERYFKTEQITTC